MLEDAKEGRINLILVKDLSRFGRNYIQVGQFTDYLFPMIGCRFVALNDGVDTLHSDNDIMPFKNLFNEFYLRDCSKKIRSVYKACQQNGLYVGSFAPYGYRKDPDDRHRLVPDEYAAPVVRRIFDMRRGGMGFHAIADRLNSEGIPSPREYQIQQSGDPGDPERRHYFWNYTSVHALVVSEVYIGHMVQNKKSTLSYKSKTLVSKPKDEWIRVENTHEPIIDLDTFQFCADLEEQHRRPRCTRDGKQTLFSGLMKCADCGGVMRAQINAQRRDNGRKSHVGYCCGTYSRCGKSACSCNMISERAISAVVLEDIRWYVGKIAVDGEGLRQELLAQRQSETAQQQKSARTQAKALRGRLAELARIVAALYEDKVLGKLSEGTCHAMIAKYEQEQAEKEAALAALNERLAALDKDAQDVDSFLAAIRKYVAIEQLDREMLLELIEHIDIGKSTGTGKDKSREIVIHYNFVGRV